MSFRFKPIDFSAIKTYPISQRKNKVTYRSFAKPPVPGASFSAFFESVPSILAGSDYREIVDRVVIAYRGGKCIILTMGAHVIKVGLSPVIIDLMRRGVINAVALNGAGSIHDAEIALIGETSEDVSFGIREGNFGAVDETGAFLGEAADEACEKDLGFGEVLGERLKSAPFARFSILAAGRELGIPVTVHVAIGSDIVHIHPKARGESYGKATFNDFKLFCGVVSNMTEGSVIINAGSAVILPTIIEKAMSVARNQGFPVQGFTGVTLDFIRHYRATWNPVRRGEELGGKGFYLVGHHELMIPLLAAGIIEGISK